ncbi:RNA methyltransferase [Cytobacillus sp. S13-E01]|uniref:TRM11 family SAM-dependent methyltransferase n=1 Tax=Cytobacillus sp. S13-E01 TaxID=3031326 RepID=UPI0023D81C30|nr:RNA methyltransferase [Cytobacillus sp. S13-E01]MDF0728175.1 RNA methyltransferase [Cytobacillus sp. S13-E01]
MDNYNDNQIAYIYTYTCRKDERSLRDLEMRSFFGKDSKNNILECSLKIDPSRSPFMKERIDVIYEGNRLKDIFEKVEGLELSGATFKVVFVQNDTISKVGFEERRTIEREIGLAINGEADLLKPDLMFAIMNVNGRWVFGNYLETEPIWLRHQRKPNDYSVALNTRVARSVANIAVPDPIGIQAIDPCCGIGTVLVEALSMGIDIVGSDINPLILPGVRENIAHFGLEGEVALRDIRNVTDNYDVAIIDLPYNLCSVITPQDQLEMFQSARRFAEKLVVITVEPIDSILVHAGFEIVDRGIAKKARFTREVIVCE